MLIEKTHEKVRKGMIKLLYSILNLSSNIIADITGFKDYTVVQLLTLTVPPLASLYAGMYLLTHTLPDTDGQSQCGRAISL